jgi:hypothetical protein
VVGGGYRISNFLMAKEVNKEVDRSKYQQTNANEDSGVDTQSQQDKNTGWSTRF